MGELGLYYAIFGLITFAAIMNVLAAWFLHRANNITYGRRILWDRIRGH